MAETNDPESNSQNEAAANSNTGVKHGETSTDGEGNFTGDGATQMRANDPLVNRDAVAPEIQSEKPETNVPRNAYGGAQSELGNSEMRVVAPAEVDEENRKAVQDARDRAINSGDPAAKMGSDK